MSRTYKKNTGYRYCRYFKGYRRSRQHHKEIRPGARVPNPWIDKPFDDICHIPYKVAKELHKRGWENERIIKHLKWKFKLSNYLVRRIDVGYWQDCQCKHCAAYRRNGYSWHGLEIKEDECMPR